MSEALAHIQKLLLGSALCRNLETVCKTVKRKRASTNVNLKPAPTGHEVQVHTFAKKCSYSLVPKTVTSEYLGQKVAISK